MQCGKCSGDAAVAKDLTRVSFMSFRKFFVETLLALFECAAESRGCDEKSEQQNCPIQAADAEDDRACEDCGDGSTFIQAVRAIREESDNDCKEETEE